LVWQIKEEEDNPNLEIAEGIQKIKCDTELRAFDARGVEHRFTPEFHVGHFVSSTIPK
jgi:hypothetical protein